MAFGTWRRISDFRLFLWFCFTSSGKPWAKGGVLTRDLARRLTAPNGLACPHQSRLPPSASPAPTSLACPHQPCLPPSPSPAPMATRTARHWYSALGSGFGSRHWVFHLSHSYIKSIVFLLFVSTDNSSSSPSSSRVNTLREAAFLQSPAEHIQVNCRCKGNCTTVRCKCSKAKAECKFDCHGRDGGAQCINSGPSAAPSRTFNLQ